MVFAGCDVIFLLFPSVLRWDLFYEMVSIEALGAYCPIHMIHDMIPTYRMSDIHASSLFYMKNHFEFTWKIGQPD